MSMKWKLPLMEETSMRPVAPHALEGAVDGFDVEVAGRVFEIDAGCNRVDIHVAEDIGDVHAAGIIVNLELGILRDADLEIGAQVAGRGGIGNLVREDVDAIAGLLGVDFDVGGGAVGDDHYFGLRPGADGDSAAGIVDGDNGVSFDAKVLGDAIACRRGRHAEDQESRHEERRFLEMVKRSRLGG